MPLLLLTAILAFLPAAHAAQFIINFNGQITGGQVTLTDANSVDTVIPIPTGPISGVLTINLDTAPTPPPPTGGNTRAPPRNTPTPPGGGPRSGAGAGPAGAAPPRPR
ncbi:MAG: hypothetical protein JNK87_12280, partial [Bryobacterales bacterium]|nr:hypothetical protein [Bryobacterales bacterium]